MVMTEHYEERRRDLVDRMDRFEVVNREEHRSLHKRLDVQGDKLDEIAIAIAETKGYWAAAKVVVLGGWALIGAAIASIGHWWKGT